MNISDPINNQRLYNNDPNQFLFDKKLFSINKKKLKKTISHFDNLESFQLWNFRRFRI